MVLTERQKRRINFAREVVQEKEALKEDEMVDLIADLILIIDEHLAVEKPSNSPEG